MKNEHAVALGRKGGESRSAAKAAAARANGRRPKKNFKKRLDRAKRLA